MSQILLLSQNSLNEQAFEKKIHQLGHEVFTSTLVMNECLKENSANKILKMFHQVVLSETITNSETKQLLKKLKKFPIKIIRKSDEYLDELTLKKWADLGIDDWIGCNPPLEVLREKLSQKKIVNEGTVFFLPRIDEKRPLSSFILSGGELKLFLLLYQQKESIISRDELCLRMWSKEKCNAKMSQLSVLVKNLKGKLTAQNVEGPIIKTCWGQGYKLHESVYDQIYIDSKELRYRNQP